MSSPFAPNLGTNYCPTNEEVLEIKALLIEPTLKVKRLDAEIAELQRAIDKLAEERDGLVAYVEGHRALITPMRRLPLDIIQEIFIACLPTHRNCVMSASETPVLLGRICGSWRAISLSTPRLWARLHVVEPTRDYNTRSTFDAKYAQRLETTKMWLGRSGTCPLSLSLKNGYNFVDGPSSQLNSNLFLRELISVSSRWRHIDFSIPASATEFLSHLNENDVPILQDVTIHEYPEARHPLAGPTQWAFLGIFCGPRISKLSVSGPALGMVSELPIRWDQLTTLALGLAYGPDHQMTFTSRRAQQILSRCPELRICRLSVCDFSDEEDLGGTIIECPLLNTLELSCIGIPAITLRRMFNRLSLPELRHFKLRGDSDPDSPHLLSFSSFLAVSTRLESVDIWTNTFSGASLVELLRGLPPTIVRLNITHIWAGPITLDEDILVILTASDNLPPCCPALRELLLSQCRDLSDAALMRFINCRMTSESCSPLERVEAEFMRESELDLPARLRPFMDAGLILSLKYAPPADVPYSPWLGLDDAPQPT
ncbi:hypothetical protein DFH07DRAFT_791200 [Mycena maculata]|uniref:F-box domain-containing protein n=1 Tax=Mycena maculata TaxID=230809 RepID=A0AAD7KC60_9AGAR|nr:hypothetical protein DFH07DRAFT_791200 [Mycena maculata]